MKNILVIMALIKNISAPLLLTFSLLQAVLISSAFQTAYSNNNAISRSLYNHNFSIFETPENWKTCIDPSFDTGGHLTCCSLLMIMISSNCVEIMNREDTRKNQEIILSFKSLPAIERDGDDTLSYSNYSQQFQLLFDEYLLRVNKDTLAPLNEENCIDNLKLMCARNLFPHNIVTEVHIKLQGILKGRNLEDFCFRKRKNHLRPQAETNKASIISSIVNPQNGGVISQAHTHSSHSLENSINERNIASAVGDVNDEKLTTSFDPRLELESPKSMIDYNSHEPKKLMHTDIISLVTKSKGFRNLQGSNSNHPDGSHASDAENEEHNSSRNNGSSSSSSSLIWVTIGILVPFICLFVLGVWVFIKWMKGKASTRNSASQPINSAPNSRTENANSQANVGQTNTMQTEIMLRASTTEINHSPERAPHGRIYDNDNDNDNDEDFIALPNRGGPIRLDGVIKAYEIFFEIDESTKLKEEVQCNICFDAKKSIKFLPCQHMCACEPCAQEISKAFGICPLCRGKIEGLAFNFAKSKANS